MKNTKGRTKAIPIAERIIYYGKILVLIPLFIICEITDVIETFSEIIAIKYDSMRQWKSEKLTPLRSDTESLLCIPVCILSITVDILIDWPITILIILFITCASILGFGVNLIPCLFKALLYNPNDRAEANAAAVSK